MAVHIQNTHGFSWLHYLERHGQSENKKCHCGKEFENKRYPGGPNKHGRKQIHCSPRCNTIAVGCRHYGITPELYWELQPKGCVICGRQETAPGKKMLAMDHDHSTGKFRGLLCNECNRHRVAMNTVETAKRVLEYLSR